MTEPTLTERVERKTLHQRVYEALLSQIAEGSLPPGTQLDEQTLSTRLGVSRTPVRGAIARLVQEGLVVNLPYRGAFVRRFSLQEIDGLYQVRAVLEALAAREAAARVSAEEAQGIAAILDECREALEVGDVEAYGRADARFHHALAEAAGNPILLEILDNLNRRVQVLRDLANRDPGLRERTARERPLILAALQRRDGEAAAGLLEAHIESVHRTVLQQLTSGEK
ncbi:MAG TPA: GntR family transcriptional regulator [Chloroflexota bacterium]|jgi:DNA-binding GntR family transcriptional regulator|nr:GntR family transcriptional regulator [Chloroflexota bacterium]